MSGHSKWSTIKRQKGLSDKKKGLAFSKLGAAITIAVREGGGIGDPASNFHLRLIIDKAKAANMPKENINRAIERAKGVGAEQLEEIVYEGYGPGGGAVMVQVATDNRLRTMQDIKGAFDKHGGTLAGKGAVSYMFSHLGVITIDTGGKSGDDLLSVAIEAGADDMVESGGEAELYMVPEHIHAVKEALEKQNILVKDAQLMYRPTTMTTVDDRELAEKVMKLIDALEELDDVHKVYSNYEIPDALVE